MESMSEVGSPYRKFLSVGWVLMILKTRKYQRQERLRERRLGDLVRRSGHGDALPMRL